MNDNAPPSIILILLITPFAVLAFFAFRTLSVQYDALAARRAGLLEERLQTSARLIQAKLDQTGTEDMAAAREALLSNAGRDIRDLSLNTGELTLMFKDGMRIFPPYSIMMVDQPKPDLNLIEREAKALLPRLSSAGARSSVAALVETEPGQHALLRCSRVATPLDVCVLIKAADVMALLRSALGASARDIALQVFLIDPKHRRLGSPTPDHKVAGTRPLAGILDGWNLEALERSGLETQLNRPVAEFIIAAFIIAAWGILSWTLYAAGAAERAAIARRAAVIAQLSHELRTPLTNMRLYLDLMERKAEDAVAVKTYASVLEAEVARLEQLSENAIEAARGSVTAPSLEEGIPDHAIAAIVKQYEPLLAKTRCSAIFSPGASSHCLYDRAALERIVVNLLDNSCKYAAGGGIEIASKLSGGRLSFSVRDHGPGIPAADLAHIFDPLMRGKNNRAPGFGIGLWAVRSLAQYHGGSAWVENANPGARFVVKLKVQMMPVGATAEVPAGSEVMQSC